MQGIDQVSFGAGRQGFGYCGCGQEFPAGEVSHFSERVYHAADGWKMEPHLEDAARALKIVPRTLYRWLNEPEFDKAYRAARVRHLGKAPHDCGMRRALQLTPF